MFERSLYDLIKGLRQHKGNERNFIEHSLRECRREIKGSDMDLKATALLKLVYLEMFGYDMSWASFNILEVMSASRGQQKRIGYLGAAQTFGPNTDVLMLATNLLKKDITSTSIPVISLPLVVIPHLATVGLANAVIPDLLTRMGHTNPNIRKKSIVTIYRLALAWPEALRPAWPKMKDILNNDDEDPSVTASVVNVVCELVWRRPGDFLPLAPRFFELLINGGNNWMAIKLIKLFATLTPLEPRLVRKLAPALTNLIKTTPAMSVLYECINGIIQGGILDGAQGIREGDEIAELCVGKLCGMISTDGDPNLKFVALLAFNKILTSHPQLVSTQQDTIISCLDDTDLSIRMQALALVTGMADSGSVIQIVGKLMGQLDQSESFQPLESKSGRQSQSPNDISTGDFRDYQVDTVRSILEMCSGDMYKNVVDFGWYIEVLTRIVRLAPHTGAFDGNVNADSPRVLARIGSEFRNVAIRVKVARLQAVEAAGGLLSDFGHLETIENLDHSIWEVLRPLAFIVGEFPTFLVDVQETLNILLLLCRYETPSSTLVTLFQAIPKMMSYIFTTELNTWDQQKYTTTALLLARVASTVEMHNTHTRIEVQETASTLLELVRISEAALSKHASSDLNAPALIRSVFPLIFSGQELNPISQSAQSKVPIPEELSLNTPLNPELQNILVRAERIQAEENLPLANEFYYKLESGIMSSENFAADRNFTEALSNGTANLNAIGNVSRQHDTTQLKPERKLYDPYYISSKDTRNRSADLNVHTIISESNDQTLDLDSIPIMELDLSNPQSGPTRNADSQKKLPNRSSLQSLNYEIAADETVSGSSEAAGSSQVATSKSGRRGKATRGILQVDSSNVDLLSSSPDRGVATKLPDASTERSTNFVGTHDLEMRAALAEVERLRLKMQREQDRVTISDDIPQEGTIIRKKKKKKKGSKNVVTEKIDQNKLNEIAQSKTHAYGPRDDSYTPGDSYQAEE